MNLPLQNHSKPEMLPRAWPEDVTVRSEILQGRLEELGWSHYRLAQEVKKVRNQYWGENITDHKNIISSVKDALLHPDKARAKQVEAIVIAMGGLIDITWQTPVTVIETRRERLSINEQDQADASETPD